MNFSFELKLIGQIIALSFLIQSCGNQQKDMTQNKDEVTLSEALNHPPKWSENQIWYQIFVERFYNGDTSNDPKASDIIGAWPYEVPENWAITPWTHDWYKREDWQGQNNRGFYADSQLRRYGGDLQGVIDKLDYLVDLGITAIYFNPLNHAPSLHKYDAASYHHIDVNFGPDPEGDLKIMEFEDPDDPATWKWTAADKLFLEFIQKAHDKGLKVVVDFSWNHTGLAFWAWQDILKKGKDSEYADWYRINSFDLPETAENEFSYEGWLGFSSLPEWTKVNVVDRKHGEPYEGDLHPAVKQHVYEVSKRWLSPNGDVSTGVDGFRLDVADQIPMTFWKDYRKFVNSINPQAYLVGEIWWKEFPDQLMDPRPYLGEAAFDAIMFYQVYRPARGFFGKNANAQDAEEFVQNLNQEWKDISPAFVRSMMGLNASHDSPRLLTSMGNKTIYKQFAKPNDNPDYYSGKPVEETYVRTKLYLLHQFTSLSSPHIWNGDEMGMWGADDPDCRKPIWWPEFQFEDESSNEWSGLEETYAVEFNREYHKFYKQLIELRKSRKSLQFGDIEFLNQESKTLSYIRKSDGEISFVAFNVSEQPVEIDIPMQVSQLLFQVNDGAKIQGRKLIVQPLSGVLMGG